MTERLKMGTSEKDGGLRTIRTCNLFERGQRSGREVGGERYSVQSPN